MLVFVRKNNDFAEIYVPLIHRKQVPLLHNTVLILCDEGDGLVAVKEQKQSEQPTRQPKYEELDEEQMR